MLDATGHPQLPKQPAATPPVQSWFNIQHTDLEGSIHNHVDSKQPGCAKHMNPECMVACTVALYDTA